MVRVVESSAVGGRAVVARGVIAERPVVVGLVESASAGGRQLVAAGLLGPRRVFVPAPRPASEDLVVLASVAGVLV